MYTGINVTEFLLKPLINAEAELLGAHDNILQCSDAVNSHQERIKRLRGALEALGINIDDKEAT